MIYASQKTLANFQKDFDKFGDSYTQISTIENLKQVFNNIEQVRTDLSIYSIKGRKKKIIKICF